METFTKPENTKGFSFPICFKTFHFSIYINYFQILSFTHKNFLLTNFTFQTIHVSLLYISIKVMYKD